MNKIGAAIIGCIIVAVALLLSLKPDGDGGLTVDVMVLFLGILAAALLYITLTYKGFPPKFLIPMRPCSRCGKGMPYDAWFCPYCGYKHRLQT